MTGTCVSSMMLGCVPTSVCLLRTFMQICNENNTKMTSVSKNCVLCTFNFPHDLSLGFSPGPNFYTPMHLLGSRSSVRLYCIFVIWLCIYHSSVSCTNPFIHSLINIDLEERSQLRIMRNLQTSNNHPSFWWALYFHLCSFFLQDNMASCSH